jgi:hypothetical protein
MTTHRRNYAPFIPEDPTTLPKCPRKRHKLKPGPKPPTPVVMEWFRVGDALQPTPKREPVSELDWAEFLAGSLEGM